MRLVRLNSLTSIPYSNSTSLFSESSAMCSLLRMSASMKGKSLKFRYYSFSLKWSYAVPKGFTLLVATISNSENTDAT